MNLPGIQNQSKGQASGVYIALVILLVGVGAFGLGRLSVEMQSQGDIRIVNPIENGQNSTSTPSKPEGTSLNPVAGGVVASRGSSKYFFPWCGSAAAITAPNKIWFASTEEAKKAGYNPASNCKGLQ